jgi:diguanylate cyclase (GGDEF)-like protein
MLFLNKKIKNLLNEKSFIDNEQTEKTALAFISLVLAIISTLMSVLNIFSMRKSTILIATSIFAILNYGFFLLFNNINDIYSKLYKVAKILFLLIIEFLFIYFFISGNPEGFGIIWSLLFPVSSSYFLTKKYSRFSNLTVFITVIFFFWIPLGRSLLVYEYAASYLIRFPLAYLAFFLVGICIEIIKNKTYQDLTLMKEKYENLAKYDSLTKIYNRQSFENQMLSISYPAALLMFDLDHFKMINDTYGHVCGDTVLQQFSILLKEKFIILGDAFRWGGEEFIVLINNVEDINKVDGLCTDLLLNLEKKKFYNNNNNNEFHITTSVGLLYIKTEKKDLDLITMLDKNLYEAKEKGRNCCISTFLE